VSATQMGGSYIEIRTGFRQIVRHFIPTLFFISYPINNFCLLLYIYIYIYIYIAFHLSSVRMEEMKKSVRNSGRKT
jgi:hypothetical protein